MADTSINGGLELIVRNIPSTLSTVALKMELAATMNLRCGFLVVPSKRTEDMFWQLFSSYNATYTARVLIPDREDGHNSGRALARGRWLQIQHRQAIFNLEVAVAKTQDTPSEKYDRLRDSHLYRAPHEGALVDGALGHVLSVSCGNFNGRNEFESAYLWRNDGLTFNPLAYHGDAWPRKFRACLAESPPGQPLCWEWMEIHESNIHGIIFAGHLNNDGDPRVVYFVVDKPPHFYQRSMVQDRLGVEQYIHSRLIHPTVHDHADKSNDVAGIPWFIQYSRVFRVEYRAIEDFSSASYSERLNQAQRDTIQLIDHPKLPLSNRNPTNMMETIKGTVKEIRRFPSGECRVALLRLMFNCHLCPYQTEATQAIQALRKIVDDRKSIISSMLFDHAGPLSSTYQFRNFCEGLRRTSQKMGPSQLRAMRRIRATVLQIATLVPAPPTALATASWEEVFEEHIWRPGVIDGNGPMTLQQPEIFEVRVYPSHVQVQGPIDLPRSAIVDQYWDTRIRSLMRFLRVSFLDNNDKPFRREPGINPDFVINHRILQILHGKLRPLVAVGEIFEFLGYSMSGLKKRKSVYMVQKVPLPLKYLSEREREQAITAAKIRDGIGKWEVSDELAQGLKQKPSKWGARLSMAFTESQGVATLYKQQWNVRDDVGNLRNFPNTDGSGLISGELRDMINQQLLSQGRRESSAFQIRFGGVKGVVFAAPQRLLQQEGGNTKLRMLLRKSQTKFNARDDSKLVLRVVSTTAHWRPSLFSAPVIKTLEDCGVDADRIETLFDETYQHMAAMSPNGLNHLDTVCKISSSDGPVPARFLLLKLAIHLSQSGISPQDYAQSFLRLYLLKLAERTRAKDLFAIPIPNSYQVLGLTDDFQMLQPGEVYVRANGETKSGRVLVYRDPIIHVGDIQVATAMTDREVEKRLAKDAEEALKTLDNVILFSQRDTPPLPNSLSGGDLDGDRFEILTGLDDPHSWLEGFEAAKPKDYVAEGLPDPNHASTQAQHHPPTQDFSISELIEFLGQYIRNDCFAELQDIHMTLADIKDDGMNDPHVILLADWLSQAVDYAKSGNKVDLFESILNKDEFKVTTKPDLLRGMSRRAFYDSEDLYYPSPKVLGRIYRNISQIKFDLQGAINNDRLREAIAAQWGFQELEIGGQDFYTDRSDEGDNETWLNFEQAIREQLQNYRSYLTLSGISRWTEVDIFLRKKLDDFPERHLAELVDIVKGYIARVGLVRPVNDFTDYKLINTSDATGLAEKYYRWYLRRAWEVSDRQANDATTQTPDEVGFGQSYAFLCLYALYFRPFV